MDPILIDLLVNGYIRQNFTTVSEITRLIRQFTPTCNPLSLFVFDSDFIYKVWIDSNEIFRGWGETIQSPTECSAPSRYTLDYVSIAITRKSEHSRDDLTCYFEPNKDSDPWPHRVMKASEDDDQSNKSSPRESAIWKLSVFGGCSGGVCGHDVPELHQSLNKFLANPPVSQHAMCLKRMNNEILDAFLQKYPDATFRLQSEVDRSKLVFTTKTLFLRDNDGLIELMNHKYQRDVNVYFEDKCVGAMNCLYYLTCTFKYQDRELFRLRLNQREIDLMMWYGCTGITEYDTGEYVSKFQALGEKYNCWCGMRLCFHYLESDEARTFLAEMLDIVNDFLMTLDDWEISVQVVAQLSCDRR